MVLRSELAEAKSPGLKLEAIYAKPKLSVPRPGHQTFPYLLADLAVTGTDQVWAAGWMPDVGWGVGSTATMKSGLTRPWATRHPRPCILRPTHTGPSRPPRKPCGSRTEGSGSGPKPPGPGALITSESKKLEVRPPAAVKTRTLQKSEREDGQCQPQLVLSFRKFFEAQTEKTQTKTNACRPRKSILIPAPSGLKNGVHLILPVNERSL